MEIFDGHQALFRPLVTPAIALGNFDGVHLGHQRLFGETVAAARRLGGDAVVFTFEPHPTRVLAPHAAPPLLTPLARKLELIAAAGMSACVVEPFTPALAAMSPKEFVEVILVRTMGARHVVVGYDFSYGQRRAGTPETLRQAGPAHGFSVEVIEPVKVGDVVASSTRARALIAEGDMAAVRSLLGRDFDVGGTVVPGDGRGRTIGIPTANLALGEVMLPRPGVYAVRMRILEGDAEAAHGGAALPGVANLGTRPTFSTGQALSFEVHLLDFSGDLYGKKVRVEIVSRLRGEKRFSGPAELVAQIHADIAEGRRRLAMP